MIDFSNGPIPLNFDSLNEIREQLSKWLPSEVQVTIKPGNNPKIRLSQGLWRGVDLIFENQSNQPMLSGYQFRIPNFIGMLLLFVLSVVVVSLFFMIVVSAAVGEFVPVLGGVGGIAGIAMYSIIERIVVANEKSAWSPELGPIIDKLKSEVQSGISVSGIKSESTATESKEMASLANNSDNGSRPVVVQPQTAKPIESSPESMIRQELINKSKNMKQIFECDGEFIAYGKTFSSEKGAAAYIAECNRYE